MSPNQVRYPGRVTNQHRTAADRSATRALALTPGLSVLLAAGSAVAEPPDSWENTKAVSGLHVLLVLGVAPLALFVLICLLVYLPSMAHGERYRPSEVWRHDPEWFGGPRGGLESLPEGAESTQASLTASGPSGGTSGKW